MKEKGVRTSVGMVHPDVYNKMLDASVDQRTGKPVREAMRDAVEGRDILPAVNAEEARASLLAGVKAAKKKQKVSLVPSLFTQTVRGPVWEIPVRLQSNVNHGADFRTSMSSKRSVWEAVGRDTLCRHHSALAPFTGALMSGVGVRVTLAVLAVHLPDRNNLMDYLKYVADCAAFCLGVDDDDSRISFIPEREKRDAYGVRISLQLLV